MDRMKASAIKDFNAEQRMQLFQECMEDLAYSSNFLDRVCTRNAIQNLNLVCEVFPDTVKLTREEEQAWIKLCGEGKALTKIDQVKPLCNAVIEFWSSYMSK